MAAAGDTAINGADVKIYEQYTNIEIKFNVPFNIRSIAPLAHGVLLHVDVDLLEDVGGPRPLQLGNTEWMAGSQPNVNMLYEYLRFDRQGPRNGRLSIKFVGPMDFSVYKSSDARSLMVGVLSAGMPKRRAEKLSPPSQPLPHPAPPPAPQPVTVSPPVRHVAPALILPPAPEPQSAVVETAPPNNATVTPVDIEPALPPLPPPAAAVASSPPPPVPVPEPIPAAAPEPVAPLPRTTKNDGWQYSGGWSQYYRYADLSINRNGDSRFDRSSNLTAESDLLSNLDFNARLRGEHWDVRTRFNGGYLADFLSRPDGSVSARFHGNKVLLSNAYIDARNRDNEFSAKLGRQYGTSGGVLGRFDGLQVGVPLGSAVRINAVAGSPVDLISNKTVDDTSTYFYGLNVDLGRRGSAWQYNLFAIQQQIDNTIDRRGVGGQLRYADQNRSLLGLADYDVYYSQLNMALLTGNWIIAQKTTLNLNLDYRENPLLTTRNALIAQPAYSSIRELLRDYSSAEVKQLARDRTAETHNATFSITQQLTQDVQLYGSVGQYYFGSMPASGGVPAMSSTGNEYNYEMQLIASNLLAENDTTSFGLRYYDGNTVRRSAAGVDARYLFGGLRLNPRLWVELRHNMSDGSEQWVYRPGLKMEYGFWRRYHIEFEVSSDWYRGNIPTVGTEDIIGNFAQLGYRIDWY